MLRVDQILNNGRYRLTRFVADDESGTMYEALDAVSNSKVMLLQRPRQLGKVTTQTQLNEMNAAFESAVDALIKLRHDNIVAVRGRFTEIDSQFLVLEPFDRVAADLFTANDLTTPLDHAYRWAIGLLRAVDHLHSQTPQVVLGELSPLKIALTPNGEAKLLVTSTVAADPNKSETHGIAYKPIEKIWQTLGPTTRRVLSRDQDEDSNASYDEPLDARSDIYSIAASVYHILTNEPPTDALERAITILDGKPDPLRAPTDIDPAISPVISSLLTKALSIKREDRFTDVSVMLTVFETAIGSGSVNGPEPDEIISRPQPVADRSLDEPSSDTIKTPPVVVAKPEATLAAVGFDDADDDLLEIDPVPVTQRHHVVQPADQPPLPEPIRSQPVENPEPLIVEHTSETRPMLSDADMAAERPPVPRARFAAMAAAAAVLLTVGIVAFNLMSGAAVTSQAESIEPPVMVEQSTPPAISLPSPEPEQIDATDRTAQQTTADEPRQGRTAPTPDKNTKPQAVAQTDREKKPVPDRTPKPKKALTVDDLLNDN